MIRRHVLTRKVMEITPAHEIHDSFSKVWILEMAKTTTAEIATKTAVHVPCIEMAFKAILIPSIPDPATQVMNSQYAAARNSRPMGPPIIYPTSAIESEECVVSAILQVCGTLLTDFRVPQLELSNHVTSPVTRNGKTSARR